MGMLQMTWQPSLLRSLKRKHGAPPLGLRNLGNSCYLNSVLQCLTYTPPLANFCLRYLHSSICDLGAGKDKKGECPFCILEKRIARSLSSEAVSDAPLKLNSCLRIYAEHFRAGIQEDAHEFLRYVIDACHNTCLRLKKLQQQHKGKNGVMNGGDFRITGETVVKEIFGGALRSQVKCLSCGAESNKFDEIMDISLDILLSRSLKDAFQRFFLPEVLDGNNKYKCDNCKELVAARKQMSIVQAPNVLVIQLKRFEGVLGGKVDKPIAFDEILVLSGHMCKASQDQHPEYELFGTIVHSGFSSDSGHYYAYIKDAIGRWYCCNDSYVSVSNLQEVLSEKVYILFFSRTKQMPQTRVDVMVNGSKSHESNGSKKSIIQKSGCLQRPVCTREVTNLQPEKNNSTKYLETNGSTSFIQKPGCLAKAVDIKNSSSHSDTNNSISYHTSNGSGSPVSGRLDCVENPVSIKEHSHSHPEMHVPSNSLGFSCTDSNGIQRSSVLSEPVNLKESSNHHFRSSNSTKSEGIHELSIQQRKLIDPGNNNKFFVPRNIKISVLKGESTDENGCTAASITSAKTEITELLANGTSGMTSNAADVQVLKRGPSSLGVCSGKNGCSEVDSSLRSSPEVNGCKTLTGSQKSIDCQDLQKTDTMVSSGTTSMKRKIEGNASCIFLARGNKSCAKVEAIKEMIEKEASMTLQSCGWSDEVYDFMHAKKKLCQEAVYSGMDDREMKILLISHAKKNFISKVPEFLKGRLLERLILFSQENQSSET